MSKQGNCESCLNYVYDEEYECYTCLVDLDEDEMEILCVKIQQVAHSLDLIMNIKQ